MVASQRMATSAEEILYSDMTALISWLGINAIFSCQGRWKGPYIVINVGQGDCVGDADSTLFLLLEVNVRRFFVDTNTKPFKFVLDNSLVCEGFVDIQNDEDQMAGFGNGNDLSTTTFAVLGSLNDTRQIQNLNFRSVVHNLAGYCSELQGYQYLYIL